MNRFLFAFQVWKILIYNFEYVIVFADNLLLGEPVSQLAKKMHWVDQYANKIAVWRRPIFFDDYDWALFLTSFQFEKMIRVVFEWVLLLINF